MSLRKTILGRRLASSEQEKVRLTVFTGVPVLGLDALSSTGYGPEAALTILVTAGLTGVRYSPLIIFLVLVALTTLYFSYRQTAAAYPAGGGAYVVAKDNLGTRLPYGRRLPCCSIICWLPLLEFPQVSTWLCRRFRDCTRRGC
jgi:amino acid transporter